MSYSLLTRRRVEVTSSSWGSVARGHGGGVEGNGAAERLQATRTICEISTDQIDSRCRAGEPAG